MALALRIFLKSFESEQAEDGEDFINLYLENIESQTKSLIEEGGVSEIEAREQSALVAIKIAIDRLVRDLPYPEESMQLLKVLSFFSERDLPQELIASCAETVSTTDGRVRFFREKCLHPFQYALIPILLINTRCVLGFRSYQINK
ncbi:hypothetical protein EB796_021212 [Bugula neritina]|uniref:Uncharacterized protein n=1 Tax=Bugula neritina TaxID=10212 RepID=A0A7J7J2Z8_BUGNE|nr:hypothetical protein EB796_021212 [Bugula neritina]